MKRKLRILGESHFGDQKSDEQMSFYLDQAKKGELLLLQEGDYYNENDMGNCLGIDHKIFCCGLPN